MNPWEEDWSQAPSNSGGMPWEEDWGSPAPAVAKKNTSDAKTALIQGIKEVPGAITGLADIPAGLVGLNRPFSRAADAAGEVTGFQPGKWAKEDEAKYSDAYKAQKAEIDAIERDPNSTAADYARFYAQNPKYTGLNIVRSVPSMALGGAYARGLKAVGGSAVARGAAGEGAVMAGQQMEGIDKNVDPQRAAAASVGTGLVGAAVGAAGGRIAQKTGLADVDTLLAGGGRGTGPVDLVKRGIGKRVAGGVVQEGAEELTQSLTEQGAKNLAEGNPLSEGMMRAGFEGTLAGSAMGGGAGAISRSRNREADVQDTRDEPADQAAQAAKAAMGGVEGPAPGMVRVYHSGSKGDGSSGRWVSTDQKYASDYRSDLPLFYLDVPENDPRVNNPDYPDEQGIKQGHTFNFELTPEESSSLAEMPRQPAPVQETPAPTAGNPLIEQQQAEQEQEARAQEAKDKRDALISKVGGVVPIAGTNMSLFNGKPYHNDDADGALDKQITKLQEAEDQKTPVRKDVEAAYVSAYNDLHKTAIANGEKKPLTFSGITGAVAKLVGGAQDPADAASRISAQIDLKVGTNGKVSPEVELLQSVYQNLTGQVHPSVARVQEIQQQEAKEKESAKPKPAVVQAAPKTEPKRLPEPTIPQSSGASVVGKNSGGSPAPQLVTVTRQGKQVQLPKETLAKDYAKALTDPKKAPIIRDITGSDTGNVMTFREAAIASLTRQKKATTDASIENERKRIHKLLAGLGITESVVDKVSAMDAADNPEMSEISENPESGIRTVNSPNSGVVDEQLSKKDREHKEAVDKILEEKKDVKTPDVTTAQEQKIEDEIAQRRKQAAAAARQAAIAKAAQSPYASEVREDWDDMADVLDGVTPKFDQLTDVEKAALVDYYEMYKNGDISYGEFEKEQRDIARSQETVNGKAIPENARLDSGVRENDSGTERKGEEGRSGLSQGSDSVDSSSNESGSTPAKAPVVAIKKKRAVTKPAEPEAPEASQDFKDAMSDLGDILTKVGRANLMPEQEKDLMGVLTRLVGAAIRMGYSKIEAATKFVLDSVKKKFGAKAAPVTPARVKTAYKSSSFIERNVSKLPPSLQGQAFVAATNVKDLIQRGVMGLSFGHDLADMVAKTLPSAKKFFDAMDRKEAVKNRLEIEIDKIASEAYKVPDRDALNKFLKTSTRSQKWGYQPSWLDTVKIDPASEAAYKKLSAQSRAVADKMFHHGWKSRNDMAATVRAEINNGFEEELKLASEADKAKIREKRKAEMHLFDTQFRAFEGPYVPLSRFGDFVMVAKSQERIDAENRGDTKWLNKEGTNPEHYRVEFHDSLGAAKWRAKQLEGSYANTVGSTKQTYAKGMSEAPWSALRRLKMMVNDHFKDNSDEGKKALTQINQLLKDLYLSNLSETAARKHDLKRQDIEGASDDMLRAFASKGKADAHFMAALLHTGEVQDALTEMRQEAHGKTSESEGRADRTNAFNEILRRHAGAMDYRPTPTQDKILMLNSVWMLLTKPAYYLQNATQPFMMSLPVMAGRSGSYTKAAGALFDAYEDLASGFGKDSAVKGFLSGNFDIDAMPIKADEKAALKKLLELGILDIGINMDMGYWESRGGLTQGMSDVTHKLSTLVKQVEVMNRVSTALASYRLAGGGTKGIEEAKHIVRTTHGNYSTFNAPSLLNKVPKIVAQFRKFQLIQLALISRLVHQSFKGETKQVKAAARASLTYTLGHYLVMAGALGMPAMSVIGMIAAMWGDEEEPEDFERMAREYIGNEEVADILLKGAPTLAGMDLSGTLGAGNMTSILPFTDIKLDSKKGWAETMMGLMGPAIGGTAPRIADGIGLMSKGDIYKGFEKMLPNGLGNAMKAYREATGGITNKNNDMTLSPEEIDLWDSLLTAMSIRSQSVSKTQFVQGQKIEFENFYKERTSEIKHRYIKAWKEGDGDTMADMRQQWQDVQMSKARNGFPRQSMSDLVKAPREQQKRERNTAGGVQFQRNSRRFVQEAAGL